MKAARHRSWVKTTYPHAWLESCLKDTYGIILFQEQVLEVAHSFAGLSLSEANEFRRLMSRFRDSGEMEAMRQKFVRSAIEEIGDELAIRVSLTQIENVSDQDAATIVLERHLKPFESIDDLFWRVPLKKDVWDSLARAGALDAFDARREVLWHLGRLQKLRGKASGDQLAFDSLELPRDEIVFEVPSIEEAIQWDFETTGITTGPHPLALQRTKLNKFKVTPIEKLFDLPVGLTVKVAGGVISRQRPPTAKGFTFLILEDETGRIPTALQPSLYEKFERVLREPSLIVEGRLEAPAEEALNGRSGVYRSIFIEKLWSLDGLSLQKAVTGVTGHPGESPRTGTIKIA